jgi:hypothetical protein
MQDRFDWNGSSSASRRLAPAPAGARSPRFASHSPLPLVSAFLIDRPTTYELLETGVSC